MYMNYTLFHCFIYIAKLMMLISPSDMFPDFILEQFGQFILTILGTYNFRVFQIVVRGGVGGGRGKFPPSTSPENWKFC